MICSLIFIHIPFEKNSLAVNPLTISLLKSGKNCAALFNAHNAKMRIQLYAHQRTYLALCTRRKKDCKQTSTPFDKQTDDTCNKALLEIVALKKRLMDAQWESQDQTVTMRLIDSLFDSV